MPSVNGCPDGLLPVASHNQIVFFETLESVMKRSRCLQLILLTAIGAAQANEQPKPQGATTAMIQAFNTHNVVMLGEWHGDKQEHEWLRTLVSTSEFADRVDDIVMEFGNSLYQKSVDRYVGGEDVPLQQVEKAWRNTVGAIGARPQFMHCCTKLSVKPT
jgi:hypothetical protein